MEWWNLRLTILPDGRIWMLIRTQTGYLYELFSDDGSRWTVPQPTPFVSSSSPAAVLTLADGRHPSCLEQLRNSRSCRRHGKYMVVETHCTLQYRRMVD